jgi:hypothetical protein
MKPFPSSLGLSILSVIPVFPPRGIKQAASDAWGKLVKTKQNREEKIAF